MATSFSFGNKIIKIPGSYSRIESGVRNPPADLDYGALLVIDTGSMANWGGGSGVNGELQSGNDSIYTFDNIQDARNFVKGGLWWDLMAPLFRPSQLGIPGISSISFIRAATTASADIAYTFTGGGANGGTFTLTCKEEGLVANGVVNGTSGMLQQGFAAKMIAGTVDTAKFKIQFFLGSYKGLDYNSDPISGIAADEAKEILLTESIEFDNIADLDTWAQNDPVIQNYFNVVTVPAGDGSIDAADLAANTGYTLAAGGTETYGTADFTDALQAVKDNVYDFILADKYGANATDADNIEILALIANEMKIKPDLYVAGYDNKANFANSITAAQTFDSNYVSLVHGGTKYPNLNGIGFKNAPAIYTAAFILGREAGQPPQVPITFKGINISGVVHQLSESEVNQSLDSGVLVVKQENGSFDVVKGVNTLQKNQFLLNEDGTTHSKQIRRIIRQINKELVILSRAQLLKDPNGVNRNTLSEEDLKNWTESYLLSITATPQQDNLIVSFSDVVVTRNQDAYFVTYRAEINSEVSFIFFTGTILI